LRPALDAVPAAIAIRDADQRYVLMNRVICEHYGLPAIPVEGRTPHDLFRPEIAKFIVDSDRSIFESGEALPFSEIVPLTAPSPDTILLRSRAPIRAGSDQNTGPITHVVSISVDISEQKRMERELAEAKNAADLANRSKSEFLANMSHELPTPLNAVIGFSEIIEGEMFGPVGSSRYRDYARDIKGSALHLLDIITDILDLSKIESGRNFFR
ncbi:MAG: PAS domain-containing sensor histidine kinase, partial [Alphaproteobacteria bacterium]|nr:PAS domain-containing sensor histidine kinase [Alphaproteobacteria bacterium]